MLEKTSMEFLGSQKQELIKNQLHDNYKRKYSAEEKSSIYYTKEKLKKSKIEMPIEEYKSQVFQIEKELFENLNLEWGVDIKIPSFIYIYIYMIIRHIIHINS